MEIPVLTAVTGAPWESDLVSALERSPGGVGIARRCVDLADLLAAAAVGTARAALISPELRRLDRDAVFRLGADGLAVVGVVDPADEAGERRLRQLGVDSVVPADAGAERIAAAVTAAVAALARATATRLVPRPYTGGSRSFDDDADAGADDSYEVAAEIGAGRVIAVWGPTGAPGRTTVAVTLADELAALGVPTLLADVDTYGGSVAQMLGVLDEAPGLAAAARAANSGALDLPALAGFARQMPGTPLRVLSGIARADRWPELRSSSLDLVWSLARSLAAVTVVDCGFCLEQDEELSFDTTAPQRNGATLSALGQADEILVVGSADPIGLHRLVRALADVREAAPGVATRVVLNKVRRGPVGPDPDRRVTDALGRFAGVTADLLVPWDVDALDRALLAGRSLREVAADSPARRAVAGLAARLAAEHVPRTDSPPAPEVGVRTPMRRLLARR